MLVWCLFLHLCPSITHLFSFTLGVSARDSLAIFFSFLRFGLNTCHVFCIFFLTIHLNFLFIFFAKPLTLLNVLQRCLLTSLSTVGLRHTNYDLWQSHDRHTSLEQMLTAGTWQCHHNTFIGFYTKDLSSYTSGPTHRGPI